MKILHVGKYYPPVKGGMESVLRDMAEGLVGAGCELRVLTAAAGRADVREALTADGRGELIRCGTAAVVASQPLTPSLPRHLREAFEGWRPDVVHVHLPNPLGAAAVLRHARRLPAGCALAVWHHADVARQRLGKFFVRPLSRRLLARAHGVAVSSEQLRESSRELTPVRGKTAVIPFGIDASAWEAPGRDAGEGFLFVGRLVYYKGLDLLLDAASREPRAAVDIVGRGPLVEGLKRRIAAEGLEGRVRLLGERDDDEVRSLMARARALVLPSDHGSETFGVVQLEALASGLPVVSTRLATGVVAVNLHEQTGLVVPPGDSPALAEALGRLLDDPAAARAWGEAGRRRVRERFDRGVMIDRLLDWYGALRAEAAKGS